MNRQEILKEVKIKLKSIKKLYKEVNALRVKAYQLNDNKSTYSEMSVTTGRGKNKKTNMVGRIYFNQKFKDESTGKYFTCERSRVVRIDGVWQI